MDYAGVATLTAAVCAGLGILIAAIAAAVVTVRTGREVKAITKTVAVVSKQVDQIDTAVNGKQPGDQTMVSQVEDLHAGIAPVVAPPAVQPIAPLVREVVVPTLASLEAELVELRARLDNGLGEWLGRPTP